VRLGCVGNLVGVSFAFGRAWLSPEAPKPINFCWWHFVSTDPSRGRHGSNLSHCVVDLHSRVPFVVIVMGGQGTVRTSSVAMYANGSRAQPFVVIKGYHMGSAWFEEAFNKLSGVSFFFEYEHCLRDLAPAGSQLASPMLTFRHLQQSCGSCSDQQRTTRCRACGVVPPPVGSTLHTTAGSTVQWQAVAPSEAPCVATGISFAAVGPLYMQHLIALRKLMPTLPVLVHVRSNLVKHALSYLRQACHGSREKPGCNPVYPGCNPTYTSCNPTYPGCSPCTSRRAPARRTT